MGAQFDDTFTNGLKPEWDVTEIGTGMVTQQPGALRLTIRPDAHRRYSDAQIADYTYADFAFRWKPPLRMTVTAWSDCPAESLGGTAGFGFWNHPFSPDAHRLPRLPQAIWFFFASPPSNMALAYGVPGFGWKASTLDAARRSALALTPLALPAAVLMRIPALYARLYPAIQRRLSIGERLLDTALLNQCHEYTLEWQPRRAVFAVDGTVVLATPFAPRGPAGFVAWIDNRWAVVTPQGRFGFGVVPPKREQSLILERVRIERL